MIDPSEDVWIFVNGDKDKFWFYQGKVKAIRTVIHIIGVCKDALMESPFAQAEPTVFTHVKAGNVVVYRLAGNVPTHAAIEKASRIFGYYNTIYPYNYRFTTDEYDQKFKLELMVGKLAGIFAVLAIVVSCIGLFGLSAYMAEQRDKEIGINCGQPTKIMLVLGSLTILPKVEV